MKGIITILLFFVIIFIGSFIFWEYFFDFFPHTFPELLETRRDLMKTVGTIYTPEPLELDIELEIDHEDEFALTRQGIINHTNKQRINNGLPPLRENSQLNLTADLKSKDMDENRYFSHYSPTGEGVGDLARRVGYDYIFLGENLALGNFRSDKVVVEAWMASPGHRKNILNPDYEEIGISVVKTYFRGPSAWIAIQHFGSPSSNCITPDENIRKEIESKQETARQIKQEIDILEKQIKGSPDKIGNYNRLVSQYNKLVNEIDGLINRYNSQVEEYKRCIGIF